MSCRGIVFGSIWLFPATSRHPIAGKKLLSFPLLDQTRRKKRKICLAGTGEAILSFLESDLNSSIENLRQFLAAVPNAPGITALALALTAVGSSLVYNGRSKGEPPGSPGRPVGSDSWFLTLNPTPFNKFVVARCPSICFVSESAADEDVHQKLSLDSHQVVTLQSRELPVDATRVDYQRRCIPAEDGGVLALDWPVSLDLEADHGLDTTIVLVPGTARGSGDETVKVFFQRALKAGYFPVVLNPRGCGNSPLTTPRIYSAGDTDDVRAGVAFISRLRPWTTLMGVAWGYGANMLAKYLGEEENLTPLTAAVSINNPFDLNEATSFMKTNPQLHEELTDGFVEILKSNKMLFQGQRHIDLAGGVIAASVREFENAVSRPVEGFKTLEMFYRAASCGRLVDQVKTPLLCIQDASPVPVYSIPRAVFEGNPYTTLMYTPLESSRVQGDLIVNLALEWLAAVELALLKGRHPLLHGVDLTIKPISKEWSRDGNGVIEVQPSENAWASAEQAVSKGRLLKDASSNGGVETESKGPSHSEQQQQQQQQENAAPEANVTEEQGQVLQAAKTVFGALDVAMPGILSEEMKDQVLEAVSRGEPIITALQNAVPEEVRGKMATAVSAAVQARGMSLQLVGFGKNLPPPTLPAGLKESIQEKLRLLAKGDTPSSESAAVTEDQEAKQESSSESDANNEQILRAEKASGEPSETPRDNVSPDAASGGEKPESHNTEADTKSQAGNPHDAPNRDEGVQPAASTDSKPRAEVPSRNPDVNGVQQGGSASVNMQQAFQALSGLDDSTQMAVNNVFGVLEGMLEQIQNEDQEQHLELQKETASLQVKSSGHHDNSKPERASSESEQPSHEPRDELRDVQTRLKKTRISGFILHDYKIPMKGEAAPAADFCRASATNVVLEAIKLEVQRRIGAESLQASSVLNEELSHVAEAVLKEVQSIGSSSRKMLSAEGLVNAVALAFRETTVLKQVIPFGVLVGVILASLVNSFVVVTDAEGSWQQQSQISGSESDAPVVVIEPAPAEKRGSQGAYGNMVHVVTAAMGATAAFASSGGNNGKLEEEGEGEGDDDSYNENIVNNIAEKAFSIAAPVVPTKDGQVDHERLVSMLTDISQKAGFLNFLGKAALLWGGLRGAMSVVDRLLVFLHIVEKPLHQRLAGFVGMVILLWSPVFVPLLPTLLNEWASGSSGGVARCASVAGLYGALVILVIIWGKKIRGYEQPLQSYGLTLSLNKLKLFGPGLIAGCAAVSVIYYIFNQLGFLSFAPSFLLAATFPQLALSAAKLLKLILEGVVIGICVSAVEELLFRSWLTEEIAVDLGQQKAILLSSFLFAILHRTPPAIPGLWCLGIALAGARSRAAGNLALPIGLHAGLIAANFVFTCGGFIVYGPAPNWMTGVHAGTPLAGALGAAIAGIFALLLYPWKVLREPNGIVTVV